MSGKIKGITIEATLDSSKFDEGVKGLKKQLGTAANESKNLNKQLKLDPTNVNLLTKKIETLAKQEDLTKKKLNEYQKELSQMDKSEVGSDKWRKLTQTINNTETEIKQFQAETEKTKKRLDDVDNVKLDRLKKEIDDSNEKAQKLGEGLTKGVTAPILGIGAASMLAWNELDDAYDNIIVKTGATGEVAEKLNESFNKVFTNIPVDADVAGEAIGEVNTQFGLMGDDLEELSELMIKYAQINNADVAQSTIYAKQAMEAYGLKVKDIPSILDSLTYASQFTGVSVDQLSDKLVKGAPQLKAMGLSAQEGAVLIGQLEQSGVDSSAALSSMAKASVEFAKDGKTLSQGLEEMQEKIINSTNETDALNAAAEVFGTKGASRMSDAIKRGTLDISGWGEVAEEAAGTVATTFEETLDPIDKAKVFLNSMKLAGFELGAAIYETLEPALDVLVTLFKGLASWLSNLSDGAKKLIVFIAGLAAVIGPLIIAVINIQKQIRMVKEGIGGLSKAITFLSSPVGIIIAAVVALTAAFIYFYNNNEDFRKQIDEIVAKVLPMLQQALATVFDFVQNTVVPILMNLVDTFTTYVLPVLIEMADYFMKNVLPVLIQVGQTIASILVPILQTLWTVFVEYILPALIEVATFISTTIVPVFMSIISVVASALVPILKTLWSVFSVIVDVISTVASFIGNLIGKFGEAISAFKETSAFKTFQSIVESISNAVETLVGWLVDAADKVGSFFDGVGDFIGGVSGGIGDFLGDINPFDSGGYGGVNRAGDNNITLSANITVNGSATESQAKKFAETLLDTLDEGLGRRVF